MPSSMKKAIFSPLRKKPSLNFEVFSNFRPVSNIKFLSKVIKKVVAMCLSNYLRHNDVNENSPDCSQQTAQLLDNAFTSSK